MCQLYGTVHGVLGVQRAKAALAVPALHGTKAGNALGLSGGINLALAQVFHHAGEAVQPVADTPARLFWAKISAASWARFG